MIRSPQGRLAAVLWPLAGAASALWYFSWLLQPGHAGVMVLFVALLTADLFNGFHAFSFWLTCLRRPRKRPFALPDEPARVDVFVATYNEPLEVLEPTVRAALALRGADLRVYVLDDGSRPAVAAMAARSGACYIARTERKGAKSGNLNHALRATAMDGAPFVVVFDADHVADPAFLERTLGYFCEERVALVQTPQIYVNADAGPISRGASEQQAIFFGPICVGRDAYGASFCCGTNFVARREALRQAGGFPEDSITEDIVLSTKLVGLGYEIAYVAEPLSGGLGPEDARSYISQQRRWATGCLDLLFRQPALWGPLSWAQRWQYFVATSYWLQGWTILVYASLPVMRLLFGAQPIEGSASEFVAHFLPYFLVAIVNLGRFTSGGYTLIGLAMSWGSFAIHVRATVSVLVGQRIGFAVTPKRAQAGVPWRDLAPNLLVVALLLFACVVGLSEAVGPASINNVVFALVDALLVGLLVPFAVVQARAAKGEAASPRPHATVAEPLAVASQLDSRAEGAL